MENNKRYIVCIPYKWDDRQVAIAYSVMAESPFRAAIAVLRENDNRLNNCNGEIQVSEAKAGRLDNFCKFYTLEALGFK